MNNPAQHNCPARLAVTLLLAPVFCSLAVTQAAAAPPTIEAALKLKPMQSGVPYDQPAKEEWSGCRVVPLKAAKVKGWVVVDAAGRRLRAFVDSNADKVVDRWCYYLNGVEVYRDIDANFNRKVDAHRWLGTAGTRWGIDKDENNQIEFWQVISAEEVTAELIAAVANKDHAAFARLLLSEAELKKLALGKQTSKKLAASVAAASDKFKQLGRQKNGLSENTIWLHFSATRPGIVPAGTAGSKKDLLVYENVVAMTETDGKQGFVQVGTLVRAGDAWRLIDAPSVSDDVEPSAAVAGLFFTAPDPQTLQLPLNTQVEGLSKKLQQLLAELEKTEGQLAAAATPARSALYKRQVKLLGQLAAASSTPDQKAAWLKQLADNLSAAVQAGSLPDGTERLKKLHGRLKKQQAPSATLSYVRYRGLLADYSAAMQKPKADYAKIQSDWLSSLKGFVEQYPDSEDAAEAMLQIAIAEEFAGEEERAKKWYAKIAKDQADSDQGKKAAGAIRRLESPGKRLALSGRTTAGGQLDIKRYAGRVVLVHYWASWCEPCKADIAIIRDLMAKYGQRGFAVVGINVDNDRQLAVDHAKKERMTWPQIHEPGGLESRPATELGILMLPTMLLLDKKGHVVSRNIHISELEGELKKRTARAPQ
jgi:thiol-disulfide isomerase/thioredoxin